jgi:hypothetical protein
VVKKDEAEEAVLELIVKTYIWETLDLNISLIEVSIEWP